MRNSLVIFVLLKSLQAVVEQMADITFYDDNDNFRGTAVEYYIQPELAQSGVKFTVNAYDIKLKNCIPQIGPEIDDYFAAYISFDGNCTVADVIDEADAHGADFIFIDTDNKNIRQSDMTNKYTKPIFLVNREINGDPFFIRNTTTKRYLTISFPPPEMSEVKLLFFYEPAYNYTGTFVSVLSKVWEKLQNRVVFEPHVVTFASSSDDFVAANCISNGRFCALTPNLHSDVLGRDVVLESIRQICVFKTGIKQYFAYMNEFYKQCTTSFSGACSRRVAAATKIDLDKLDKCLSDSFDQGNVDTKSPLPISALFNNFNHVLGDERDRYKVLGVSQFPDIYINRNMYRGTLSYNDLLLSLCAALKDDSSKCRDINLESDADIDIPTVLAVSLLIFVLGVVLLNILCKKIAKRRYMNELNKAVDKYVSEFSVAKEENANI